MARHFKRLYLASGISVKVNPSAVPSSGPIVAGGSHTILCELKLILASPDEVDANSRVVITNVTIQGERVLVIANSGYCARG